MRFMEFPRLSNIRQPVSNFVWKQCSHCLLFAEFHLDNPPSTVTQPPVEISSSAFDPNDLPAAFTTSGYSTHITFHHNLVAHSARCNPCIEFGPADVRNNVIYDYNTG